MTETQPPLVSVPVGGTEDRKQIAKESVLLFGTGTLAAIIGAAGLAADQSFLGTFGDSQQLLWQARNLVNFLTTGSSLVTDSFYGVPTPMAYMPTSLGEGTFVLLFEGLTGSPWFAVNLGVLLGLVANLVSMYACMRILNVRVPAALLGGFMFMMAPQTLAQAMSGHMWFAWTFLIPPLFLLILYAGRHAPKGWWLWFGIVLGAFVWVHEYFALFAAVAAIPMVFVTILRQEDLDLRGILAGGVVFALLIGAPLWMHLERRQFDADNQIQVGRTADTAARFSSDPLDFVQPSAASPAYRRLPDRFTQPYETEPLNYLGLMSFLALAGIAFPAVRRGIPGRQRSLLVRTIPLAVVAIALSFGTRIPTDGTLSGLADIFYRHNIYPFTQVASWARFGVFAFAWFAALAAMVADQLLTETSRIAKMGAVAALMAVIAVDQFPFSSVITHRSTAPQQMLAEIDSESAPGFVMHVPLDPDSGYRYNAMAQFLQTFHGRPIVNGYTPVANPAYRTVLTESGFGCLDSEPFEGCPDTATLGSAISAGDLRWVIFDRFQRSDDIVRHVTYQNADVVSGELDYVEQQLVELARQGFLERAFEDDRFVMYRVTGR